MTGADATRGAGMGRIMAWAGGPVKGFVGRTGNFVCECVIINGVCSGFVPFLLLHSVVLNAVRKAWMLD